MSNNSAKYQVWAVCAVLAAITFAAFAPVLHNGFINFDDDGYITENQHIQKGFTADSIKWAFTTKYCAFWHPVTWLSHIIDYRLFGLNPRGHHLVSMLLHTANTVLLFIVLRAMTAALWKSAFIAAAFAVHPLHVESVAWASERKDVLSGLFWMLTMGAYLRYVRRPTAARYLLTLLLFALGLMAKPMLVTLPFVMLLLDYWPLDRLNSRTAILEKTPFFVLSATFSAVAFLAQKSKGAVPRIDELGIQWRIANAVVSYVKYIRQMFWPSGLSVHYPYDFKGVAVWSGVAVLFLLIVSILIIRLSVKYRYLLVGWLWYLGTLVPVIGLVQVGGHAMADRYTYIPLTGLFIIAAWGAEKLSHGLPGRKTVMGILAAGTISALVVCTNLQVHHWHDSITVFEHAVMVTRENSKGYYNLGVAYDNTGQTAKAIEAFQEAVRINPDYAEAHNNLGVTYSKNGRYAEAIEEYKKTAKIKPDSADPYNNLGAIYGKLGWHADAIKAFKETIKIKPDYAEAYDNLGVAYGKLGRYTEAIEAYKEEVKIKPDNAQAYNSLGVTYGKLGQHAEAIEAFKEAIRVKPDYSEAQNNLGVAYGKTGLYAQAIEAHKQAVRIKPDYAEAYNNLGTAYGNTGYYNKAIEAFKEATRIRPDYANAQFNLGVAYLEAGETAFALEVYKAIKVLDTKKAEELFKLINARKLRPATSG